MKCSALIIENVKRYKKVEVDIPDDIFLRKSKPSVRRGINDYMSKYLAENPTISFEGEPEERTVTYFC